MQTYIRGADWNGYQDRKKGADALEWHLVEKLHHTLQHDSELAHRCALVCCNGLQHGKSCFSLFRVINLITHAICILKLLRRSSCFRRVLQGPRWPEVIMNISRLTKINYLLAAKGIEWTEWKLIYFAGRLRVQLIDNMLNYESW